MSKIVDFGTTGAWISLGMRPEFDTLHSMNGCLDAPEMLYAGGCQRLEGQGPKALPIAIPRGEA